MVSLRKMDQNEEGRVITLTQHSSAISILSYRKHSVWKNLTVKPKVWPRKVFFIFYVWLSFKAFFYPSPTAQTNNIKTSNPGPFYPVCPVHILPVPNHRRTMRVGKHGPLTGNNNRFEETLVFINKELFFLFILLFFSFGIYMLE